MAQVVERILGKDEVGSSSLPSSSKKDGFLTVFFYFFGGNCEIIFRFRGFFFIATK